MNVLFKIETIGGGRTLNTTAPAAFTKSNQSKILPLLCVADRETDRMAEQKMLHSA